MSIETEVASSALKTVASPILHYIYGGIIAVLIASFIGYTVHEQHVGEAKIVALDKAHATELAKKDQVIADNAQLQLIDVGNHAKILLSSPPIANAGLVCVAPRSATTPAAAKNDGGSVQVGQLQSGSFDPSGAILTLLSNDDIRINALIDTIEILNGYIESLTLTNNGK
jgi:hypothetical protein